MLLLLLSARIVANLSVVIDQLKSVTTMTNTSPINRKRYAGFADTAAYAGYSVSHLRALVRDGKFTKPIRPFGPGGKCIFDLDLVDHDLRTLAIEQGVIPPTAA